MILPLFSHNYITPSLCRQSIFSRHFDFIMKSYDYMEVTHMTNKIAKFTLRTDSELMKKFRIVADYNARSANREMEVLIKNHVAEFEKKHGKIELD